MKKGKQERAGKLPDEREVGGRRGSRYRNRREGEGGVRGGGGGGRGRGRGRGKRREEENRQKVGRIILDYRQGIVKARGRRETEEATGPVPSPESTVGCLLVDQVA